ncbi:MULTISPECIES: SDR family NAD(P)-dependent oxidoreductase [Microbacterium]|uniref:SDR family NAD(P)-dependent oxidoreductase n=1 Tax=Microbacterium TaxID=33882 RepID=UPI00146C0D37|nr:MULTISPECIES: SDR family NAD(P)-dependent oxidoreductase [Microbacterium]
MTVIVTGGARGIGLACTRQLLERGERVVVVDQDVAPLDRTLQEFRLTEGLDRLVAVSGDVADTSVLSEACELARGVDGVVACAGISRPGPTLTYPRGAWDAMIEINLSAVFETFRVALPVFTEGASFVAISSISGSQGFSGRAAYSATKAGVEGLVRSLAIEYAPRIRVNAVSPGYIMTDLVRQNLSRGVIDENEILDRTPMGRWGEASDIADAVEFLLSPKSSWITGSVLTVDGGWTALGLGGSDRAPRS